MSESDEDEAALKRAHWVSLRTLQRVPNVVGETDLGEPIVEIGSTRLVLPHGANNFYHLSACASCRKERISDVVLTTAHLSQRRAVYCPDCAAASTPQDALAPPSEATAPPDPEPKPVPDADAGSPAARAPEEGRPPEPQVPPYDDAASRNRPDNWDALVSEVSAAVGERLEQDRVQLVTQLANAVSGALERHRQALATEVADTLSERLQTQAHALASEVGVDTAGAVGAELHRLGEILSGRLDEGRLELMAQLEGALGVLPENPRLALASEVATAVAERIQGELRAVAEGVDSSRAELLGAVGQDLAGRLDERARALRAGVASDLDERARALRAGVAADLDERFGRDLVAVTAALEERLGEDISAMATSLEKRFNDEVHDLAGAIEKRFDTDVQGLGAALAKQFVESQSDVINRLQDVLSAARADAGVPMSEETATSFFAVRADLYRKLDHAAEEAAKAGMNAARVMLRATEQHVVATSAALAGKIAELEAEVADARETMTELRRAVDRMTRRMPEPAKSPAARKAAPRKTS